MQNKKDWLVKRWHEAAVDPVYGNEQVCWPNHQQANRTDYGALLNWQTMCFNNNIDSARITTKKGTYHYDRVAREQAQVTRPDGGTNRWWFRGEVPTQQPEKNTWRLHKICCDLGITDVEITLINGLTTCYHHQGARNYTYGTRDNQQPFEYPDFTPKDIPMHAFRRNGMVYLHPGNSFQEIPAIPDLSVIIVAQTGDLIGWGSRLAVINDLPNRQAAYERADNVDPRETIMIEISDLSDNDLGRVWSDRELRRSLALQQLKVSVERGQRDSELSRRPNELLLQLRFNHITKDEIKHMMADWQPDTSFTQLKEMNNPVAAAQRKQEADAKERELLASSALFGYVPPQQASQGMTR